MAGGGQGAMCARPVIGQRPTFSPHPSGSHSLSLSGMECTRLSRHQRRCRSPPQLSKLYNSGCDCTVLSHSRPRAQLGALSRSPSGQHLSGAAFYSSPAEESSQPSPPPLFIINLLQCTWPSSVWATLPGKHRSHSHRLARLIGCSFHRP